MIGDIIISQINRRHRTGSYLIYCNL